MERRRGDDEDRGVDEQRERQRDGRVDEGEPHRLALAFRVVSSYCRVCTIDECRYRLCGMTVAPRMPMAMYSISGLLRISRVGMKPVATAPIVGPRQDDLEQEADADDERPARSPAPRAAGSPCSAGSSTSSTSSAVIATPQASGMPNSRLSAMAEPITSARSQAAIAISQSTQSENVDRPASSGRGRPAPGRAR